MSENTNGAGSASSRYPNFGEVLNYLRGLGFTVTRLENGVIFCRETGKDTEFLFRARPEDEPFRDHEWSALGFQLTYREYVTRDDFDRIRLGMVQPAPVSP